MTYWISGIDPSKNAMPFLFSVMVVCIHVQAVSWALLERLVFARLAVERYPTSNHVNLWTHVSRQCDGIVVARLACIFSVNEAFCIPFNHAGND
jgi:hypothetical protein